MSLLSRLTWTLRSKGDLPPGAKRQGSTLHYWTMYGVLSSAHNPPDTIPQGELLRSSARARINAGLYRPSMELEWNSTGHPLDLDDPGAWRPFGGLIHAISQGELVPAQRFEDGSVVTVAAPSTSEWQATQSGVFKLQGSDVGEYVSKGTKLDPAYFDLDWANDRKLARLERVGPTTSQRCRCDVKVLFDRGGQWGGFQAELRAKGAGNG